MSRWGCSFLERGAEAGAGNVPMASSAQGLFALGLMEFWDEASGLLTHLCFAGVESWEQSDTLGTLSGIPSWGC